LGWAVLGTGPVAVPGWPSRALYCCCCNARTEVFRSNAAVSPGACWYDSEICLGMKLMAGSLVAVWKLFSEWISERELSCRPRGGARARGLCRADVGGPGVRAIGGSSPGEEGFRGIGAVRGAGRASVPVPFCFLAVVGGTGGTTTGKGTMGGAELPEGASGGWTGRNDWFGGWLGGCCWLGGGWVGRNDW